MEVKKKIALPEVEMGNEEKIGKNRTPKDTPTNAKPEGSVLPGFAGNHFELLDLAIASC